MSDDMTKTTENRAKKQIYSLSVLGGFQKPTRKSPLYRRARPSSVKAEQQVKLFIADKIKRNPLKQQPENTIAKNQGFISTKS